MIRQLSLFGADGGPPDPADLAGLLCGRGQISTGANLAAQIAVPVDHPWRAAALVVECARRGLAATSVSSVDEHTFVRTAHTPLLAPLLAWMVGPVKRAPKGLVLGGHALRLWAISGGRFESATAYSLPVDGVDDAHWEAVGAALALVGLGAQLVSPRGHTGASYRIVGTRRLGRLAEMIGEPPKQAPLAAWPR